MSREKFCISLMALITILLFVAHLFIGSVKIPANQVWNILLGQDEMVRDTWRFIILESRLPQALTSIMCGMALAASGLMLQTIFRNPLAGPSILGIDSGASLGVALVMLLCGSSITVGSMEIGNYLTITLAAFIGALFIMGLLLYFSSFLKSDIMLLIVGIMLGYVGTSIISLLSFFSTAEGVHSYIIWGMGSFSGVSMERLPLFSILISLGIVISLLLVKPLNAILLGDRYAKNLGINVRQTRFYLLIATGLLSATTTAFCGPISFLGLTIPHMARLMIVRSDHKLLMPLTLLTGSAISLLCSIICVLPGEQGIIPLNAVTPLLGAPVILYVLLHGRRR